jgi:hypothetical protein
MRYKFTVSLEHPRVDADFSSSSAQLQLLKGGMSCPCFSSNASKGTPEFVRPLDSHAIHSIFLFCQSSVELLVTVTH